MIFTKEELAILKEADRPLRTYYYGKYVSGCSQATAKKLLVIYQRVTNDTTKICTSCTGGLATIFKTLAPMYLEELEKMKPKRQANGKRAIQSIRGSNSNSNSNSNRG
jgi:hypothetical protein